MVDRSDQAPQNAGSQISIIALQGSRNSGAALAVAAP
jgi:hypothetical protein